MTKVAYYYHGNKKILDEIKDHDPIIIVDNIDLVDDIVKYNLNIKNIKYLDELFDIIVSDNDNFDNLSAMRKVAIGEFKTQKDRIMYLDKYDESKIFAKLGERQNKFSIIIPNFNNGDWIGKTIQSVLDQTYQNWEMYVIDDMSTDNSVEVVESFKDKRINLTKNEIKLYNGGSRNIGILKAKKSNYDGYLFFIDSDDWLVDNNVLENLNKFIQDEDLITMDYQYYGVAGRGTHTYKTKDDLFMTNGSMCAVWCKCFKTKVAPLFEFNTLMEDRNYHYRLINRIKTFANYGRVTHVWNKKNVKSITTLKEQLYDSPLQAKIEWNNCAYRHIAGMLDLLNELDNPLYISFIKEKIAKCKMQVNNGIYQQL